MRLLVLGGDVIALLALAASQRDDDPHGGSFQRDSMTCSADEKGGFATLPLSFKL
jgi:hypothetical protein